MRNILILSLCLLIEPCIAQFAIVQDPDGYSNLRSEPDAQSSIICRVPSGRILFVEIEYWSLDSTWVLVYFNPNPFSISFGQATYGGYIHQSRLLNIENLPDAKDAPELRFKAEKADSTDFFFSGNSEYPDRVNGIPYYGVETGMSAATRCSAMELIVNGDSIPQSPMLFEGLFNLKFDPDWISTKSSFTVQEKKWGDSFFILMMGSDGAGGYHIVWEIKGDCIVQRWVGSII
ncbi:hypothetical protein [Croceimicrobium sp.]|uniref:hypothetical protein n=1 Tax=Croceimicrobium sp. TaxID=2828340 RepID=UPI003BAAC1C3